MGTKAVPLSYLHICDGCGAENNSMHQRRPNSWCNLTVGRDALDYQGMAVGSFNIERLLCSDCAPAVVSCINSALLNRAKPIE
jgi:hypothetical protein